MMIRIGGGGKHGGRGRLDMGECVYVCVRGGGGGGNVADRTDFNKMVITIVFLVIAGEIWRAEVDEEAR